MCKQKYARGGIPARKTEVERLVRSLNGETRNAVKAIFFNQWRILGQSLLFRIMYAQTVVHFCVYFFKPLGISASTADFERVGGQNVSIGLKSYVGSLQSRDNKNCCRGTFLIPLCKLSVLSCNSGPLLIKPGHVAKLTTFLNVFSDVKQE